MTRAFKKWVKPRLLQRGDLVLKVIRGLIRDPRGKFRPNWSEPYFIRELIPEDAAWLMDLDRNRFSEPTNVDQLKSGAFLESFNQNRVFQYCHDSWMELSQVAGCPSCYIRAYSTPLALEMIVFLQISYGLHYSVEKCLFTLLCHYFSDFGRDEPLEEHDLLVEHLLRLREPVSDISSGLRVVAIRYTKSHVFSLAFKAVSLVWHSKSLSLHSSTFRVVLFSSAFRAGLFSIWRLESSFTVRHSEPFVSSAFRAIISFQFDIQSHILSYGIQGHHFFLVRHSELYLQFGVQNHHPITIRHSLPHFRLVFRATSPVQNSESSCLSSVRHSDPPYLFQCLESSSFHSLTFRAVASIVKCSEPPFLHRVQSHHLSTVWYLEPVAHSQAFRAIVHIQAFRVVISPQFGVQIRISNLAFRVASLVWRSEPSSNHDQAFIATFSTFRVTFLAFRAVSSV
ncbi:hypothetical protein CK203_028616 [Vitis vinifera]|uniref:Uncharacterized protein n=1 Tax=Vitis vinifera TaxID=29760 RepID=A0A438I278_VITVI|nr:hypothetical protein CK203_028616 [Vitis vinifera]